MKLRLGIMCQGDEMPVWQRGCIERMVALGSVEISLLILDMPENYPKRSLFRKVIETAFSRLFFVLYLQLFLRPKSLRICSVQDLFKGIPMLSCRVQKKGRYSQYFSENDIATIRSYNLDMILRFGFNIIRGEILQSATHGVWSFHHDDEQKYRGGPPCFWEIYHGDAETGSVLQRLTEKLDAGIVLKKGIFRTKSYSYCKNIDQAYFESAKWPAFVCKDILNGTANYLNAMSTMTNAPIYRYPTNLMFMKFLFLMQRNRLQKICERLFLMQYWNVALVHCNFMGFLKEPANHRLSVLTHVPGSINADCFGRCDNAGRVHLFFEHVNFLQGIEGKITWTEIGDSGNHSAGKEITALQLNAHASYPFLYEEDGSVYMIPETAALKQTILFECTDFPFEWKMKAVLLSGEAMSDSTLLKHDNKYWLFFTVHNSEYDSDLHLHLAFADQLCGPYMMHPQNPVKISSRSSRPAGSIFLNERNELIRPAQNFCKTYGGSIVFNKIEELTETSFKETEIQELKPFHSYYKDGIHTFNILNDHTCLIDMKRHVFRFKKSGNRFERGRMRQQ